MADAKRSHRQNGTLRLLLSITLGALVAPCAASVKANAEDPVPSEPQPLVVELRINGEIVPDFQEVLSSPAPSFWLPIEAIAEFSEGAVIRDADALVISLASGQSVRIDLQNQTIENGKLKQAWGSDIIIDRGVVQVKDTLLMTYFGLKVSARVDEGFFDVSSNFPLNRNLRKMREQLRGNLGKYNNAQQDGLFNKIDYDYSFMSGIQADVIIQENYQIQNGQRSSILNVNASSELAYLTHSLFLGGTERGIQSARWIAGRFDPEGQLFGIGGLHSVSIGDVVGQAAPMVGGLGRGAGIRVQAAPMMLTDSFNKTSVEGDAQTGWTAELYVAGQLRDYQLVGDDGRFKFSDIDILYGSNSIKVVLYGPNGAIQEKDFSQTVSAGILPPGRIYGWATVIRPGTSVLGIEQLPGCASGQPDYAARADVGVAEFITISASRARTTFCGANGGEPGQTSFGSYQSVESRVQIGKWMSTLGVVNQENSSGMAFYASTNLPIGGRNVGITLESATREFETFYTGFGIGGLKNRLQISASVPVPALGSVAIFAERFERKSGSVSDIANFFYSHNIGSVPISHELFLTRSRIADGPWSPIGGAYRAIPSYDINQFQIRAEYQASLGDRIRSQFASLNAVHRRDDLNTYTLGVNYDFKGSFGVVGSAMWDLGGRVSAGLTASHSQDRSEVALRLGFSLGAHRGNGFNISSRERANFGAVAIRSFYDNDYDGNFGPGDTYYGDLDVNLNDRLLDERTPESGRMDIWDLDTNSLYRFDIGKQKMISDFLSSSQAKIATYTRPGRIFNIDVPIVPAVSLSGFIFYENGGSRKIPLQKAIITFFDEQGRKVLQTQSMSDGYFNFDQMVAGKWEIQISFINKSGEIKILDHRLIDVKNSDQTLQDINFLIKKDVIRTIIE
jgi:hypothetical protein